MLVLFPLTAKQAKSMIAMQRAQPEIKKLQAKYKNDRAKLNEESDEVLPGEQDQPARGLSAAPGPDADLPRAVPRHARALQAHPEGLRPLRRVLHRPQRACSTRNECNVPKLGLPNPQDFLGMDLSQNATAVTGGFLDALPYFILVGLVIITGVRPVPPEPSQRPEHDVADGDDQHGAADRLRPLLAAVPRRPRPLLPGQQPVAPRPAGADHAQDHRTRAGPLVGTAPTKDDAIDVAEAIRPSAFPRAAGGLRKLFQLPAAPPAMRAGAPNGANGATESANGTAKPTSRQQQCGEERATRGSAGQGVAQGTAQGRPRGRRQRRRAPSSGRAPRNNKKRKRR